MIKIILFFSLLGCAQVTSLNLQKHQFGKIPTKIIWLQVAGLSLEQLAMLKFSYPSRQQKTSFEEALCIGNAWEYNLYKIRPSAQESFMSQLTGKKNIKGDCSDYEHKPIWKYVSNKNYKVGIFEGELPSKHSLVRAKSCSDSKNYLQETIFWSMNKAKKGSKFFHINEANSYKENNVYYDKSCQKKGCFTTLSRNVESVYKSFSKNAKNMLFIVRNFEFQRSIRKRNAKHAREELEQVGRIFKYFQDLAEKDSDMLVLLTSADAVEIDFPKSGREWKRFEGKAAKISAKNSKLISAVLASGARAENFCGIYDQSEILGRIFSGSKQQGLEFSIINPFGQQ